MKTIKGDLILTEDFRIDDDLKVNGNIICKGGRWNIICYNIDCDNLNCNNIDCDNLNCYNIDCRNLDCINLNCFDISFYDFCIAYYSFKCISATSKRKNFVLKCLDGEIEYKGEGK